jgi:aflatoxin B1 aldehyde reductase
LTPGFNRERHPNDDRLVSVFQWRNTIEKTTTTTTKRMKTPLPRLYFGTMTFAWSQTSSVVDESVAMEMVKRFIQHNEAAGVTTHHIDTARVYAGGNTEPMVGAVLSKILSSDSTSTILVGTKAHPSIQPLGLSKLGIQEQMRVSLQAMQRDSVDEYYLHQPDTEHTLLESLQCAHELVQEGKASLVGMSNYHASEMARAFQLCQAHGLTSPTVYQGLYNPLNRLVEDELVPLLKQHNCSFVAYNPLAAGLLTGKHSKNPKTASSSQEEQPVAAGRFKDNPNYLPRFYTPANFAAVEVIGKACEREGISMVEATYRWMLCHSILKERDGILLGASSLEQLDQNLKACQAAADQPSLSPEILTAFDEGWKLTQQEGVFPYWRSYSSDMPHRDSLDPGASYNAAKTK